MTVQYIILSVAGWVWAIFVAGYFIGRLTAERQALRQAAGEHEQL